MLPGGVSSLRTGIRTNASIPLAAGRRCESGTRFVFRYDARINALGDGVNEAARIEACARSGLALASKDLVERLEPGAAAALGLEPDRITYTPLGDLATATEKARRDAPAIAVCEV